jgi:predicted DNA-binding transcriptional regulator YafY
MPDYTRVHRLLRVLTLIQGREGWTPARLAEECGVGIRTIFRDLNELEGAGIGIEFDHTAKTYRVPRDFFLPPVQLTAREALSLSVLCEQVAASEQIPFVRPAVQAMEKIQASLPLDIRDEIAKVSEAVYIQIARTMPPDGHEDMFDRISHAITTRRVLRCRYESLSGDGDGEEFAFRPYALYFAVRAWYAVGHHGGRGETRTLKLSRFVGATATDEAYEIPEGFSLRSHLGNAWRMIRGEPTCEVVLAFDESFAETIADTMWHRTQRIEAREDGGITFRCTVDGLDEIVWWVLSMGSACRVIEPAELRERVRAQATAVAAMYAGDAAPPRDGGAPAGE